MKIINWLKYRITHKLSHFSIDALRHMLVEHGLALVVIFCIWEVIEDIVSPAIFIWLGININELFYIFAPASLLLCFHWLAIPAMLMIWIKIKSMLGW